MMDALASLAARMACYRVSSWPASPWGGNQSLAYCTRGTNPAWLTCPLTTQDGRSLSLAVTDGEFVFDVKPDWDLNAMTERLRAGTT